MATDSEDILVLKEDAQEDEDMWLYGEDAAAEMNEARAREAAAAAPIVVEPIVSESAVENETPTEPEPDEEQNQLNAMFDETAEVPETTTTVEDLEAGGDVAPVEAVEKNGNKEGDEDEEDDDDDDDDDDDVQVTIGDIKAATPGYNFGSGPVNLNITKRGSAAFATPGSASNAAGNKGKGATLDFNTVGQYNGESIYEVNLDNIDDKPWRKPGADITDYFNYGFTEDTWKIYCERQKKLRADVTGESLGPNVIINTGLSTPTMRQPFTNAPKGPIVPGPGGDPALNSIVNENSKYAGSNALKKAGPPPCRKPSGTIDVIGGGSMTNPSMLPSRRPMDANENFNITVLGSRPPPPGMPPGPPPFGMLPPFGMPPLPGMEFPPGMPMPPPGFPMIPGGPPLPFPPGDFIPRYPPPQHIPGEPNYEEEGSVVVYDDADDGGRESRDRGYGGGHHRGERSGRGGGYGRDSSYRDREQRDHRYEGSERSSRDHESSHDSSRRHRSDRDRDEKRDSERDRDREGRGESRRRHHDDRDDEHKSSSRDRHSSSKHTSSKRIKREKEDD